MDFSQPPTHVDEILKLIARSASGREALERFLPLLRRGKVRLAPYPPEVIAQLKEYLGPGQPVGACFVNDGETGTIHFDGGGPLGVLAPFILHEIIHCLDTAVWEIAKTGVRSSRRDKVLLHAETRAFEAQHRFVQELSQRFPEFESFLESQQARVKILVERLTSEDIASLYGFKAS